jgi:hypothetical protein
MDLILVQLVPYFLTVALTAVPAWRLFGRVGMSRWWTLISVAPFFGPVIILWIVAYARWDNLHAKPTAALFE